MLKETLTTLHGTSVHSFINPSRFQFRSQNCEKRLLASSCPSICPHGTNRLPGKAFYRVRKLSTFRKSIHKIQLLFTFDKNYGYFTWRLLCTFMIASGWIIYKMIHVSDKNFTVNQNEHFIFKNLLKNYSVYEIMWKNMVQTEWRQMNM